MNCRFPLAQLDWVCCGGWNYHFMLGSIQRKGRGKHIHEVLSLQLRDLSSGPNEFYIEREYTVRGQAEFLLGEVGTNQTNNGRNIKGFCLAVSFPAWLQYLQWKFMHRAQSTGNPKEV